MAVDLDVLGQRVKAARLNSDMSQEDVAKALGLARAAILQIENGTRNLSLRELDALAKLYGRTAADFLAEDPADILVSLLRTGIDDADTAQIESEILRHVSICRVGRELEALLDMPMRSGPPTYELPPPTTVAEAVDQGNYVALQERRRVGIGDNPVPDMAELICGTGIWPSGSHLLPSISGLFLKHPSFGMVILVNYSHSRARKRFSYAHEYAHSLLDRAHVASISTQSNRTELREVRANSFAATFLLPPGGIRAFLTARGKGLSTRLDASIYDPDSQDDAHVVRATRRPPPGSQKVSFQDVASLAHLYQASYQAAAYRLKTLGYANEAELQDLLNKQAVGKEYLQLLGFYDELEGVDDTKKRPDREIVAQVTELAIEAYRRGKIKKDRLLEIGSTIGVGGRSLMFVAEAAR